MKHAAHAVFLLIATQLSEQPAFAEDSLIIFPSQVGGCSDTQHLGRTVLDVSPGANGMLVVCAKTAVYNGCEQYVGCLVTCRREGEGFAEEPEELWPPNVYSLSECTSASPRPWSTQPGINPADLEDDDHVSFQLTNPLG